MSPRELTDEEAEILDKRVWVVVAYGNTSGLEQETFRSEPTTYVYASTVARRIMQEGFWSGFANETANGTVPSMHQAIDKGEVLLVRPTFVKIIDVNREIDVL